MPTIVHGETTFTESMAACVHIAETHKSDLVIPLGHPDRADYLQWLWCGESTLMSPIGTLAKLTRLPRDSAFAVIAKDAKETFALRLRPLEQHLAGREFSAADHLTLADISIGYPLYLAGLFRIELPEHTAAYWSRLNARPALQKALAVS